MSNMEAAESRGNSAFKDVLIKVQDRSWEFLKRNYAYFLSFLLPAVILFIAYVLFEVWPFGERSVLSLDLNAQYAYYFDYMHDVIAGKESLFYSWSRNLSGEFMGIIGYYLASPFNILVWIWDRAWLTEGLLTMMLTKAATCGLTMAFLLKKHRGYSNITTIAFSVMYALCGYFVVQTMNPMWLDGVLGLPLVVMGVERICDKRRFKLYVLSLVYIFVANFYIGFMVGVFSALYFLFYLASGKSTNKCFGELCGAVLMYGCASVSAILSSAFMLLPSYKSLTNGKFDFTEPDFSLVENFDIADTFIKLFPTTYDTVRMEGMPALYAGTLAIVFTVIYFLMKKYPARERISAAVFISALMLFMYIRPVDMICHGGQMPNWLPYRYSFMISFLIVLFGAQAFEDIRSVREKWFGTAFGILLGMLLFAELNNDSEYYKQALTFAIPFVMLGIICIIAYVFRKYRSTIGMNIALAVLVCAETLLNTSMSLYDMHKDIVFSTRSSYRWDIPLTREVTEQVHELDDGFYRMEKTYHRCVNDPIALRMYGMSHSSSMLNAKPLKLLKDLGFSSREHYSRYDGATVVTDDIFGVKYVLAKDARTLPYTDILIPENEDEITAYMNPDAFGIAYLADGGVAELVPEDYTLDGRTFASPFKYQNALANALTGTEDDIFHTVTDVEFKSDNIRTGMTVDVPHHSYRKKDTDDPAWISYDITMHGDGPVYMYLPTDYERETQLYIDGEYRANYFKYENYSIEYLGTYKEGDTFNVKLQLLEDAVFIKEAQFYYADMEALERFNSAVAAMNAGTKLVKNGDRLELTVNAEAGQVLFTTIPAEEGWTAYIDGEEAELITTLDGALIAVKIPTAGKHTVTLEFFPAGLKTGLIFTLSGIILFVLMILVLREMKKRDKERLERVPITDTEE